MTPDVSEDAPMAAVTVDGLRVVLAASGADVVDEVSFAIEPGEVLGLVGESGSGKTTVGLALLGHARRGLRIVGGKVVVGGVDVLGQSIDALHSMRGKMVSYVPQDPSVALNPALRVGLQLREILEVHHIGASQAARDERIGEILDAVMLPGDRTFLRRYPHELSGGQQQRIGLAMAFACHPRLVVLDEPTTGLDVTTQAHVLETVRNLSASYQVSALYISHDLAVISDLTPRVVVMYAGRIVELGGTRTLFTSAQHPYTRKLIAAIPRMSGVKTLVGIPGRAPAPGSRPRGCAFAPRCEIAADTCRSTVPELLAVGGDHRVRCLFADQRLEGLEPPIVGASPVPAGAVAGAASGTGSRGEAGSTPGAERTPEARRTPVLRVEELTAAYRQHVVLHGVSLEIARGECLALVGESGSGKTTLACAIAGLHRSSTGRVILDGHVLAQQAGKRPPDARRRVQYVFQNPYGSLNPRRTIRQIVRQPLDVLGVSSRKEADRKVAEALGQVSLSGHDRYPDMLSGGERQRVAIARALVSEPDVLICDEVTSALDVSVQAAIVALLARLQSELGGGMAMLFVTHNLPLVRSIAQRVAVMHHGRIVELGDVDEILANPSDPYTQRLISDSPALDVFDEIPSGAAASRRSCR